MALHQGGEGWLRNEEREPNSVPQRRLKQRTFIISAPERPEVQGQGVSEAVLALEAMGRSRFHASRLPSRPP